MTKIISITFAMVACCLTLSAQPLQSSVRPKIQNIAARLKKENVLHLGAPVGITGELETRNKYYRLFQKLGAKATNDELVTLTNDKSKIIVLYAFNVLSARGYPGLKEIFLQHVNDTADFWMSGGCTGVIGKVNSHVLRLLNPEYFPDGKAPLSQMEYDKYLAMIDRKL